MGPRFPFGVPVGPARPVPRTVSGGEFDWGGTSVKRYFSLVGDLFDLEQALERKKDFHSIAQILACSALVKVVGDFEDIYISHDTWFLYRGMLRIQKRYIFPWHYTAHTTGVEHIIPGHTITMSSYAGKLVSWDNFYLTSAGLAITETSIANDNKDLWKFVVPQSGPFTWVSAAVASRLATSGLEWVRILGRENGGTAEGPVWRLGFSRQVPHSRLGNQATRARVGTCRLRTDVDLWCTLNARRPPCRHLIVAIFMSSLPSPRSNIILADSVAQVPRYFSDIFNMSEQLPKVQTYGNYYTFENAPRAKIFRRDHVKVKDMSSMIKLMRYNDFKNDPLSRCNCSPPYNPTYAVAPRYDLIDPHGMYDIPEMYPRAVGGIDVKVTNYTLFASLEFVGVSGPTWENQPPFQWSNSGFPDSHVGHPDKWQFEPVVHCWAEPRVKWSYKLQQPTNSAARPAFEAAGFEPAFDGAGSEPAFDEAGSEPAFDEAGFEPAFDGAGSEPAFDGTVFEPAFDEAGSEAAFDEAASEAAFDEAGSEPAFDEAGFEPAFDGAGSEAARVLNRRLTRRDLKPRLPRRHLKPRLTKRHLKPAFDEAGFEPAFDGAGSEPAFDGRDLKPRLTRRDLNPPAFDEAGSEPAFDEAGFEPAFDGAGSEPAFDEAGFEPAFDGAGYEPAFDGAGFEPAFDEAGSEAAFAEAASEAAFDEAGSEPAFDEAGSEPAFDEAGFEPAFDGAGSEPAFDKAASEAAFDEAGSEPAFDEAGFEPARDLNPRLTRRDLSPRFDEAGFEAAFDESGSEPSFDEAGFAAALDEAGFQPAFDEAGFEPAFDEAGFEPGV
ncbi:hypothetical protein MTO96_006077 [Rhipicephalus appendiculatus]